MSSPITINVGDLVTNFSTTARVVEIRRGGLAHDDGRVRLVLQEVGRRVRWLADPAKCHPAG